jgi:hypothetical protein
MDLPHRYSYNPRPRLILFVSEAGLLWIGMGWFSLGRIPTGIGLWLGIVLVILALLLAVRRVSFDRRVLLEQGEMILPTGPLQIRTAHIPYSDIQRVWRHNLLPGAVVLRIATEKHTFEIVSFLLPNAASYCAIEDFLSLKARENAANGAPTSPD